MTLEEFQRGYDPCGRIEATYMHDSGEHRRGIVLDGPWKSLAGHWCVHIDGFHNKVAIAHITSVRDTEQRWT